jgi:TRAP-type mannitol/chloroaromatic compound transport system substrate-binding protein
MDRRNLIKGLGLSAVAAGAMSVSGLAQAQSQASVEWRCQSSFPKNLDTIFGGATTVADWVEKLTGGKFKIKVYAAGEIAPGLQALDVTKDGTVECAHTCGYYFGGKDSALAVDTAVPFGLLARQQQAWFYHGNGLKLLREVYSDQNVINFPAGNTNTQMGGWFRKDIKSLADLKG